MNVDTGQIRDFIKSTGGNGHHAGESKPARVPRYFTAGQLVDTYPDLCPVQIDRFLRAGEVGTVVSGSKCRKTFLMLGLAVQTTVGGMWLGEYQTRRANVLYLDNELHPQTSAHRIREIAQAEGVPDAEWRSRLCVENFRGDLPDIYELDSYFRAVPHGKFGLIILDSLYRTWPSGMDENSNGDVTKVYNALDRYASITGAAILMVHHASKGSQGNKQITDVGAGAGSIARAADLHMILRPHEQDNCVVLEAETRSFPKPAAAGLRWSYPKWFVDPFLDATKLRKPGKNWEESGSDQEVVLTPETFAQRFVTQAGKPRDLIVTEAVVAGISEKRADRLLMSAVAIGKAHKHVFGPRDKALFSTDPQRTLTPPETAVISTRTEHTKKQSRKPRKEKA